MGDLHLLAAPAAPPASYTTEVWRGCWACGLVLFHDEPDLCTDCHHHLNNPPAPTPPKARPLYSYLKHFGPQGIALMAAGIVETGADRAEEHAANWAADHLEPGERARYVGDVRGRALREYSDRCQQDVQLLGAQLGWKQDR